MQPTTNVYLLASHISSFLLTGVVIRPIASVRLRQGHTNKHPCLCVLFVGGLTATERQSVSINIYHSELQVRNVVSREQL